MPQDWLAALQALLPPGRALTREPGSTLSKLQDGVAAMLLAAQQRLEARAVQFDPRRATDMIPDWEALLGLPDACTPSGLHLPDRQRAAYARLVEQGGQSRAYFVGVCALLGEPNVTITEFRPFRCGDHCNDALYSQADRFVWQLNIPRPAQDVRVMTCDSPCASALQAYTPSVIECALRTRQPAHTAAIFAYAA